MIKYLPSANGFSAVSSPNDRPKAGPLKVRIRADSDSLSGRTHLYCFSFVFRSKTMFKWTFQGKPTTQVSTLICYMLERLKWSIFRKFNAVFITYLSKIQAVWIFLKGYCICPNRYHSMANNPNKHYTENKLFKFNGHLSDQIRYHLLKDQGAHYNIINSLPCCQRQHTHEEFMITDKR